MRRGDVVAVAAAGDGGTMRSAVIVQTDAFPTTLVSVVVCPIASELVEAPDFRVTLEPSETNGLSARAQVIADKPVTIRRERIGRTLGHLGGEEFLRLNSALAFVMGLAD